MKDTDVITRLAAARPPDAVDPAAVVSLAERDHLLRSIVSSGPSVAARRAHPVRDALVVAAAAGVLAGGVTVADVLGGSHERDVRTTVGAPPPDVTLDRIQLAVAKASDGVVHIRSDFGNGVLWETWLDQSGRWRSVSTTNDGRPLYEHQVDAGDAGTTVLVVSHRDRAWWTYEAPEERGEARHYLTPEEIRAQLADGTLEEVAGDAGDDEIHLRGRAVEKAPGSYTAALDLWVDARTYLPVRSTATLRNKTPATSTYTWLARAGDALRQTRVVIPPGYRQLPGAPEAASTGGAG